MQKELLKLKVDGLEWLEGLVEAGHIKKEIVDKVPEAVTAGVLLAIREKQIDRARALEILTFAAQD